MIIVEGPDNAGKSTLVNWLEKQTGVTPVRGQGPEKYPGEMEERIASYPTSGLLDRHPAISNAIYDIARGKSDRRALLLTRVPRQAFYVYCRPPNARVHSLETHNERPGIDTPPQLELIRKKHIDIVRLYDRFYFDHALGYFHACLHYDWTSPEQYVMRMLLADRIKSGAA